MLTLKMTCIAKLDMCCCATWIHEYAVSSSLIAGLAVREHERCVLLCRLWDAASWLDGHAGPAPRHAADDTAADAVHPADAVHAVHAAGERLTTSALSHICGTCYFRLQMLYCKFPSFCCCKMKPIVQNPLLDWLVRLCRYRRCRRGACRAASCRRWEQAFRSSSNSSPS